MDTASTSQSTLRESMLGVQLTRNVSLLGIWVLSSLGGSELVLPSPASGALDSAALCAPRQADRLRSEERWRSYAGYQPRTLLGRRILEARRRLAAKGFRFLSLDELDRELGAVRERGFEA